MAELAAPTTQTYRVIAYVDAFNLYFGLKDRGWKRYYWLNIQSLASALLARNQRLVGVKYFTSRVSGSAADPDKPRRQNTYLEALQTLPTMKIFYGHYLVKPVECFRCHAIWQKNEEKMTDVNIATELLVDAFDDRFDTALLVTADSDLTCPVETVRRRFPQKRIVIAFPPNRFSDRLRGAANSTLHIGRGVVAASQFPEQVAKPDGFVLRRPSKWR
jgi:uncharacterized LabA/DUF88 family protein